MIQLIDSKTMKVSDVMSKQLDIVRPTDRVEKAALLIFGRNINSIPVCEGKKIVGIVTEKDIMTKFLPSVREFVEDTVHASNFDAMEEKASLILSFPVEKIMSKNPFTIKENTPLLKAQAIMSAKEIGRLPIINEKEDLVGILSKGDVFRTLIGEKLAFTENEDYNDFLSKTYYKSVDWANRLKFEMPDLKRVFDKNKVKTILDVGCGTGDHSIEFARRGYFAVGVDRSKKMIQEAVKRRSSLSKKANKNLKFFSRDTEALLDELEIKFDAILFMGNTLSHNPSNYKNLIKKASSSLSEKGIIIIQNTNFEKVLQAKNRLLNFSFAKVNDATINEYAFLEFYDKPKNSTILKTFLVLSSDGKRWRWSGVRNSLMVYLNEQKIKELLSKEGLSKIEVYGSNFDGRSWDYIFRKPFKPLESDWLNIIASKS